MTTEKLPQDFLTAAAELYSLMQDSIEPEKQQNINILEQLKDAISHLTDEQYTAHFDRPVVYEDKKYYSPIGSHVRHTLDFYLNFLNGVEEKTTKVLFDVDYDLRDDKNPASVLIATKKSKAIETIEDIQRRLKNIHGDRLGKANNEGPNKKGTTIGRELPVMVSHTTHHMHVLVMMAGQLGIGFGPKFGVAQSTQVREQQSHVLAAS